MSNKCKFCFSGSEDRFVGSYRSIKDCPTLVAYRTALFRSVPREYFDRIEEKTISDFVDATITVFTSGLFPSHQLYSTLIISLDSYLSYLNL